MKFNIECDMPEELIPHFLGMLTQMEHLGKIGNSGKVALHIDGEKFIKPEFRWDTDLPESASPKLEQNGNSVFDMR